MLRSKMALDTQILEALEMHDFFAAIKVTEKLRMNWLKGAKPSDRWAVTLTEGGVFSYGRSLRDAIGRAMGDTDTTQVGGAEGLD